MTDAELVALSRNENQNAFGELTQRHWLKCVSVGCFYLRNRVDAEDCVQNAFLKAFEHLDQFHGVAQFSAWLSRIVANECLMLMRVGRRTRFVYIDESPSDLTAAPFELPGTGPDPEGDLGYSQLTEALRTEVMRIPPLLRNVMLLRDIQGIPLRDVADQLGITVAAAKSRLVRARAELRVRMMHRCGSGRGYLPLSRTAVPLDRVSRHLKLRGAY